jgi:hypothetical protein
MNKLEGKVQTRVPVRFCLKKSLSRFPTPPPGKIPESPGHCVGLAGLVLNRNKLGGKVQTRAAGRPQISLSLFFCTGQIPESLGNYTKLGALYRYQNGLGGKVQTRVYFCLKKSFKYPPLRKNSRITRELRWTCVTFTRRQQAGR